MAEDKPAVLFLCIHNAGRSQMALGWFKHLADDRAIAWSGGSEPANETNPLAVAAMSEVGIDITGEHPKLWTDDVVRAADVVVTMGCGDACPYHPGKRYEDWELDDPAGQPIENVRRIRDDVERRVRVLLAELGISVVTDEPSTDITNEVSDDGVFRAVRDGYEAVYGSLPHGETFNRIWRDHAYRGEFPIEFAHIGFLTESEARHLLELLDIRKGDTLVDVACGAGGPGLWAARETGARLVGIDPAEHGLAAARQRADRVGLSDRAEFRPGSFEHTTLDRDFAHAVMTIEAFQYAPDKRAALGEFRRILRPGGRVGIVCFEVDPEKAAGLPVLGVDAVADYTPLLADAGFTIDAYEETPGWEERVYGTFSAVVDAADALSAEMGERAAAGALSEAMLTVAMRPYRRRVLIVATAGVA